MVGGNPARIIKYRFDEEMRVELQKIDFSNLDLTKISNDVDFYYQTLTKENLSRLLKEQGVI
ncbi:hypothetical protein D3C87_2014400 [compost metagenome]